MMTNSVAVNAILDLKKLVCDENQIDIKYFVLEELPKIDETDLCVILANLLDNAMELHPKKKSGRFVFHGNHRQLFSGCCSESNCRVSIKNNKELGTTKKNRKSMDLGCKV